MPHSSRQSGRQDDDAGVPVHRDLLAEPRFGFGANWTRYLRNLDDAKIESAQRALLSLVGTDLTGARFVDIGSGSGLHSLAAWRSGAHVTSVDYDADSVACTAHLRDLEQADGWVVEQGSVLDTAYLDSLGAFDVVYSWGVLHHTGAMWQAIENAAGLVAPGGRYVIAIYNYIPGTTERWRWIKRKYNTSGRTVRAALVAGSFVRLWGRTVLRDTVRSRNPWRTWRDYGARGMDPKVDLIDWVGGYPYEAARPEDVIQFVESLGFSGHLVTKSDGHGCNEFRFQRATD